MFEPEIKTCVGCNRDFTFRADEQEIFLKRGLKPRRRCHECAAKRAQKKKGRGDVMETWEYLDRRVVCETAGCNKYLNQSAAAQMRHDTTGEPLPKFCHKCQTEMAKPKAPKPPVPAKRCWCGNDAATLVIATVDAPHELDYGVQSISEIIQWVEANCDNAQSAVEDGEYRLNSFCSLLCLNLSLSPMATKR